jgi:RNA polymerase sigma-70 factor, ECF subfamily
VDLQVAEPVPRQTIGLSCAPVDEAAQLERLRSGDEAAYARLVRTYQTRMLRLARGFVPSQGVAEEVVQDTWLGVVRGIDRFEGRSSVATWLFTILVNRAKSAGQRERRHWAATGLEVDHEAPEHFDASGAWAPAPEVWAEEAEDREVALKLAARARACLDQLPPAQREVVLLRDVEGLDAAEVCSVLGISDANQRVLLHRGRGRVRCALAEEVGQR